MYDHNDDKWNKNYSVHMLQHEANNTLRVSWLWHREALCKFVTEYQNRHLQVINRANNRMHKTYLQCIARFVYKLVQHLQQHY